MKTKTIFLFIMVLIGIGSITKAQVVPQNQFVYWEDNEFKLDGETFVMKGINYSIDFSYKILLALLILFFITDRIDNTKVRILQLNLK